MTGITITEPPHDETNKLIGAPSKDSDQTGLIGVFAGRSSHFVGFVMRAAQLLKIGIPEISTESILKFEHCTCTSASKQSTANSADTDQKPSDLGLHCLSLRLDLLDRLLFSKTRVRIIV